MMVYSRMVSTWRLLAQCKPRLALSCRWRGSGWFPQQQPPRRNYYDYKPGEQTKWKESLEVLAHRDLILFRYEDSGRILRYNAAALLLTPLWLYLGHFSWTLSKRFDPYRDKLINSNDPDKPRWVLDNVDMLSRGVGAAFAMFGVSLTVYWLSRSLSTVKRLVLRKGGKHITLVTYGLLGNSTRTVTVPVNHCSAVHQHFRKFDRLFLRVKDKPLKYQLNVQGGHFVNRPLYDRTVGISRNIG